MLLPALREELGVTVPEDRGSGGRGRRARPSKFHRPSQRPSPIRIRYARCSTVQQELLSQLAALEPAFKRIFSEEISTRIKTRPELEKALKLAYNIKEAARDQEVILTVKSIPEDLTGVEVLPGS
ncbi:recombinase family protein [Streptomyces sp. NPDC017936]|uniref:recombinase family protein n=1 Tax=Streptomyces sp. NPDC017936 TaxID=3365016 RepID=UPI0037A91871